MPNKGKTLRVQGSVGLLVALQLLLTTNAHAQDDLVSRRAAAERYERTMPIVKVMDESIQQMALSLPNDQRGAFVAQVRQVVDGEQLRLIALDKMTEVFSAEELNALADFYGSPVGQSIVTKFPVYMAEVMPLIQLELARALRKLKDRSR
ncbi:MAG TPA: DUF2059 domain-containing protein [Geminicoccaceae bacterium]|nr:DUF2059 domain-containing protein [Geminicoccaceae bacterium]